MSILLNLAFMGMLLATTAMSQPLPPPSPFLPRPRSSGLTPILDPAEVPKCWSSLTAIQGCVMEVYTSLFRGQVGVIGPACCQAITQLTDNCWPKMFPFNPLFPPLLKTFCSATPPSAAARSMLNGSSKLSVPGKEVEQCWSSLASINGCLLQIFKSVSGVGIGAIGPACCEAIVEIEDNCWPKLFPFNPFLPPLLKNSCAPIAQQLAAPPN